MGAPAADRIGSVRRAAIGAALALALAGTAGCSTEPIGTGSVQARPPSTTTSTAPAAAPSTSTTSTPGAPTDPTPPVPELASVDALAVRPADDPGGAPYRRDEFGDGWAYDPSTGCNVRERVLIEESLVPPQVDDRCRSSQGRWRSAYDGVETDDPADLQVDHVVPLSDAWRAGAATWTRERRLAFANDLEDPATLVAVTGRSNQQKGDRTPDEWLPEALDARCGYVRSWVRIKARWDLSVHPAEKSALVRILEGC